MPSASLQTWHTLRSAALDELLAAHTSLGGTGPGRRYATQQINQAYAILLSSQFQGYCRDLHDECADYFVQSIPSVLLQKALQSLLFSKSQTGPRGNPNPGNIRADYNRYELTFWENVRNLDSRNRSRLSRLEELNRWRNAIAHQAF